MTIISAPFYDWVSAIVIDDWTNCEKIIKHLKNQKKYLFQGINGSRKHGSIWIIAKKYISDPF